MEEECLLWFPLTEASQRKYLRKNSWVDQLNKTHGQLLCAVAIDSHYPGIPDGVAIPFLYPAGNLYCIPDNILVSLAEDTHSFQLELTEHV